MHGQNHIKAAYIFFVCWYRYRVVFLEVKRPQRDAGHSPPSSTEVMNVWSYTSTTNHIN